MSGQADPFQSFLWSETLSFLLVSIPVLPRHWSQGYGGITGPMEASFCIGVWQYQGRSDLLISIALQDQENLLG